MVELVGEVSGEDFELTKCSIPVLTHDTLPVTHYSLFGALCRR